MPTAELAVLILTSTTRKTNAARTRTITSSEVRAEKACFTIGIMFTNGSLRTERITAAETNVFRFIPTEAVRIFIMCTIMEPYRTIASQTTILFVGECQAREKGSQRYAYGTTSSTTQHCATAHLLIGHRFAEVFKPVRHCHLLVC